MSTLLNNLRNKPLSVRNRYALFAAAFVTLIIIGLWIMSIKSNKTDQVAREKSTADELKPLFLIFNNFKTGVGKIKENAANYKAGVGEAMPLPADSVK